MQYRVFASTEQLWFNLPEDTATPEPTTPTDDEVVPIVVRQDHVNTLGDLTKEIAKMLIAIPDPRLETHERYDDWVDPFSEGCYEITNGDYGDPVVWDQQLKPRINYMQGMCGFRITFTNHDTVDLAVKVMRDFASTLGTTSLALAAAVGVALS